MCIMCDYLFNTVCPIDNVDLPYLHPLQRQNNVGALGQGSMFPYPGHSSIIEITILTLTAKINRISLS